MKKPFRYVSSDTFVSRSINDVQQGHIDRIQLACSRVEDAIIAAHIGGGNREFIVALTKLEEVSMWATKGVCLEMYEQDTEDNEAPTEGGKRMAAAHDAAIDERQLDRSAALGNYVLNAKECRWNDAEAFLAGYDAAHK